MPYSSLPSSTPSIPLTLTHSSFRTLSRPLLLPSPLSDAKQSWDATSKSSTTIWDVGMATTGSKVWKCGRAHAGSVGGLRPVQLYIITH